MKKGAYLTHVPPLRPYEWAVFDVVIAVKGPGRLKPGTFKGLILKKEGVTINIVTKLKGEPWR